MSFGSIVTDKRDAVLQRAARRCDQTAGLQPRLAHADQGPDQQHQGFRRQRARGDFAWRWFCSCARSSPALGYLLILTLTLTLDLIPACVPSAPVRRGAVRFPRQGTGRHAW